MTETYAVKLVGLEVSTEMIRATGLVSLLGNGNGS